LKFMQALAGSGTATVIDSMGRKRWIVNIRWFTGKLEANPSRSGCTPPVRGFRVTAPPLWVTASAYLLVQWLRCGGLSLPWLGFGLRIG